MDIRDGQLYMDDGHMSLVFTAIMVAMFGGFVNWLKRKGPRRWGQLFVSLVTAGFVGLMSHYVTNWLEFDFHLQFFVSGIAGYSGVLLLDDAVERLRGLVKGK